MRMPDKSLQQKMLEKILRAMGQSLLRRHKPTVVGITGSVGKTSTREAIFHVLNGQFCVRQTYKNYNNEIGVPLTIIGTHSGGRSPFGWMRVCIKWAIAYFGSSSRYPDVLILELGIDRPGDMAYLLRFVHVDIAVVTAVTNAHQEFFADLAAIAKEKGTLVTHIPTDGTVILNGDDRSVRAMARRTDADVTLFGCTDDATLRVSDIMMIDGAQALDGMTFKVNYEGKSVPVRLNHVVARHQIYAVAAAISVAVSLKMNLVEIAEKLVSYHPPAGRMNQLRGKNGSTIIDDTYNSSPKAAHAALGTLKDYTANRRIAVLGDMLELGADCEREHKRISTEALKNDVDIFFAVGERMEIAYHALVEKGFDQDKLFYFENPMLTGQKISEMLQEGDVVLVKGSQGMRMEKIVEHILADGEDPQKLLCRQDPSWKAKNFTQPQREN